MFGRKTIIVANASAEHVRVQILSDTAFERYKRMTGSVQIPGGYGGANASSTRQTDWDKVQKEGYTIVKRNNFVQFTPDAPKKTCYVTIQTAKKVVCRNHPIPHDRGLIIGEQFSLIQAAKGDRPWIDSAGNNHDPSLRDGNPKEASESFQLLMSIRH